MKQLRYIVYEKLETLFIVLF